MSIIDQDTDNIYVNINFNHREEDGSTLSAAEYKVTKTIPILDKCDDYFCSVVRFDISLTNVPLYIFPVKPNSGLTNESPMIIGIRVGGVNYSFNLIYVPENNYRQVNQNDPRRQIIDKYYFVYNYQNMIESLNIALAKAYVASGLSLLGNEYPYFFLDYASKLISLVVDSRDFAPTQTPTVPNPIPAATIYVNESLQHFISGFAYKYIGDVNGREYELNLVSFGSFNNFLTSNQKKFNQEYVTLFNWSALKKIVMTTNSIPIVSEYTPTNSSGISSSLPILTDFTPELEFPGQSRSIAYYTPSAQYRLVNLKSSGSLYTIDVKIYWQDIFGNLYPLTISVFEQASIKIGFFKKSLYKEIP